MQLDNKEKCLYDRLPSDSLIDFYYYIHKNIENGILSNAMYSEMALIKIAAKGRGILLPIWKNKKQKKRC